MKLFRVDVDVKATETYYIYANNPKEALEKVESGDYNENGYSIDIHSTDYENADIYEE